MKQFTGFLIFIFLTSCTFAQSSTSAKEIGGLLLQKSELQKILKENKKFTGLAFKLKSTESIDLEILGVKWEKVEETKTLTGLPLKINFKKAISMKSGEISNDLSIFEFEFKDVLVNSQFGFSMVSRDELEMFFEIAKEGLIISASIFTPGAGIGEHGQYFTLKIHGHQLEGLEYEKNSLGIPGFITTDPCPPRWFTFPPKK